MLQGVPHFSPVFLGFVEMVRAYMRDMPHVNRVVAGEESSKEQIMWAVLDAVSDFNGTPPFTHGTSLESLLERSQTSLLMRMTVITLLESISLLQMRNHVNYSAGGISVGVNDKAPQLMQYIQYMRASVDQQKQRAKIAMNIESLLNSGNVGLHSEYAWNGAYFY